MNPKPITLTQADTWTGAGDPQPFVVIGTGNDMVDPAAFVAIDDTPADAAAVAADLEAVRDALIAAGLMAAS